MTTLSRLLSASLLVLVGSSALAANTVCSLLKTSSSPFQGTLGELGVATLYIAGGNGSFEYYNGHFGSNVTATCTEQGIDTALVTLTGSFNKTTGKLSATLVRLINGQPLLRITSTQLPNQDGGYTNVTGTMSLGAGNYK
jgi:hypothetical protein